jgi:hypothetical protein
MPTTTWGVAILICLGGVIRAASVPLTNLPPSAIVIPQSVFVTNAATGKDPFFPNSARLKQRAPSDSGQGEKKPGSVSPGALRLLGITKDSAGRRIALINNLTFAEGEVLEVRAEGAKLRLRCVEIREKSVVVAVDGQSEQQELVLPEKVLPTSRE